MTGLTVGLLREAFRHLQVWRATYESQDASDILTASDGTEVSLWDIEYLYRQSQALLPEGQRRAIELCLYRNVLEKEAAVAMGVSPTNPVGMYASSGLEKLIALVESGSLSRFREEQSA